MRRLGLALALGSLLPSPVAAELVVFGGGDVLRVEAYEVDGERVRLELPSGGELVVPIRRIERIVDDEIDRSPPDPTPPTARLRFLEDDAVPDTPYGELIFETARRHDLNPALVAAVVGAESAFDADAVSPKGARGLMQLMPATADRFGVAMEQLFDPASNIEAGTRYLDWLTERFDRDPDLVLAAYNAGEGAVAKYDGVPPYRETRTYLGRVYARLGLEAPTPSD